MDTTFATAPISSDAARALISAASAAARDIGFRLVIAVTEARGHLSALARGWSRRGAGSTSGRDRLEGPTVRSSSVRRFATLLALSLLGVGGVRAGEPMSARDATADLYARMSANDLAGVSRYLPANGFTELGGGGATPHRIDAQAFAGLFKSGATIALRVTDVQVQTIGDTAIVTGVRIGSITPAGETAVQMTAPFTMVWTQAGTQWQLRHVHLSTPVPA